MLDGLPSYMQAPCKLHLTNFGRCLCGLAVTQGATRAKALKHHNGHHDGLRTGLGRQSLTVSEELQSSHECCTGSASLPNSMRMSGRSKEDSPESPQNQLTWSRRSESLDTCLYATPSRNLSRTKVGPPPYLRTHVLGAAPSGNQVLSVLTTLSLTS